MAKAEIDRALSGLDALEFDLPTKPSRAASIWSAAWPKLGAAFIALGFWQLVVWSHWKPDYILPGPGPVLGQLWHDTANGVLVHATLVTLRRAVVGYGVALVLGVALGMAVARQPVLRRAIGSMITGLQTMPSIAWFPLAIVLFNLSEKAMFFVVVLGAAPAIANGLISGIDQIPPVLLKAGRVLGARGTSMWRHVILPAALPGFAGGLKQGWAFAWRSLMAGELLVIVAGHPSIGTGLQFSREVSDAAGLYMWMIVIFILGVVADSLFGSADKAIRRRWGLLERAA
jgi:NitT/TauT family transport system permease protein